MNIFYTTARFFDFPSLTLRLIHYVVRIAVLSGKLTKGLVNSFALGGMVMALGCILLLMHQVRAAGFAGLSSKARRTKPGSSSGRALALAARLS